MQSEEKQRPMLIGIGDTAELLAVSTDTIRRLIQDRELPAMRCGRGKRKGHLRIRRDAVLAFIQRREAAGVT